MIKTFLASIKILALPLVAILLLTSCSKSDSTPATTYPSKEYKLYNVSTGSSIEAGTFTITQLADGNAKLNIQLNAGYRVSGVVFKANITVFDVASNTELVYADLGDVNGASGTGEKNPVLISSTSSAVKYTDLVAKTGYIIKILNGSNVQARGVIN